MMRWAALVLFCPVAAQAQGLALPGNATLEAEVFVQSGSYRLPTGVFDGAAVPSDTMDGAVIHQAWRVGSGGLTTLQLISPLQDQLEAQGYDILLSCDTDACGGFDFRFGTDVLPPPEMYVDLGDFRFVSARRGTDEAVSILVSRSPRAGFIQIITMGSEAVASTSAPALRL